MPQSQTIETRLSAASTIPGLQPTKPVLKAVVRDVRTFALILRAIAFTTLCHVSVADYGLQFTTEVNGVLQATAYLTAGLFNEYTYTAQQEDIDQRDDDDEDLPASIFEISLSDLLVCLNIYGNAGISIPGKAKERDEDVALRKERERRFPSNGGGPIDTEMTIIYEGQGSPLRLELQEGNTSTRCELTTYEVNPHMLTDMPFRSDNVIDQVIMASKDLTDALQSIDATSKEVTFSFSNTSKAASKQAGSTAFHNSILMQQSRAASSIIMSTAGSRSEGGGGGGGGGEEEEEEGGDGNTRELGTVQMMMIKSEGDNGSTELHLPNQNRVFEQFTCSYNNSKTYQFADLQRCLKALQTSLKTSLRICDEGMMDLQCLFPKRVEQALNPHVDTNAANNRNIQLDPESQGYVELKLLPIFQGDEDDED
ncbi:hypothetical protein CBS101457_002008 [Exobasidium rhododendri]|nr:hypothetical protein CBS101457_002008 [Exobasidium rhododendri]